MGKKKKALSGMAKKRLAMVLSVVSRQAEIVAPEQRLWLEVIKLAISDACNSHALYMTQLEMRTARRYFTLAIFDRHALHAGLDGDYVRDLLARHYSWIKEDRNEYQA